MISHACILTDDISNFLFDRKTEWFRVRDGKQHRGSTVLAGITPRVLSGFAWHRDTAGSFPGGCVTVSLFFSLLSYVLFFMRFHVNRPLLVSI